MEIIEYQIQQGDTLESIAEKRGISIKDLINFHNQNCGVTGIIIHDGLPPFLQYLFLEENPITITQKKEKEKEIQESLWFSEKARYRCEQFNTTKLEDNITFHCNTQKEYTFERSQTRKEVKIRLKDFLYKINPENLAIAIEATKELEFEKENVVFLLDDSNKIQEVQNFNEIREKWEKFKPTLKGSEFYKQIEKINNKAADDIIKGGEIEFENEENLKKTYDKNLFYHVIFNDFIPKIESKEKNVIKFLSQIFVEVWVELEVNHSIIKEDDYFVEYKTTGVLQRDKLDDDKIEKQYNEFYKPIIEYGFSEYNYKYSIIRRIEKKSGLIVNATALMLEEVKNNYQLITQFDLKKIDF